MTETKTYEFGVKGINILIGGKIPEEYWISTMGPPGSFKTIIGLHFINESLVNGGGAVIVVSEETEMNIVRQASKFNMEFDRYIREGRLKILSHLEDSKFNLSDYEMTRRVADACKQMGYALKPKRLMIDSLVSYWADKPASSRKISISIKSKLVNFFECAYCTIQMASTTSHGFGYGGDFLSDGLIEVGKYINDGKTNWYIFAHKMRAMQHSLNVHAMKVIDNVGVVIGKNLELKGRGMSVRDFFQGT
jgi:KaiC/GvpD/RAD55 family RecA-like ATPase